VPGARNDPTAGLSCGARPAGGVCGPFGASSGVAGAVRDPGVPDRLPAQRDRNKAGAGAEPMAGRVSSRQWLQFFL
jgi:hypothetical protein